MPPVTPSSKSGSLITWLVVFVILWLTATIFAIYYYVDGDKARKDLETVSKQYDEVIAKSELEGPTVAEMRKLKDNTARNFNAEMKIFDVLSKERGDLAKQIDGGASPDRSYDAAVKALTDTTTQLKDANIMLDMGATLTGATKKLADALVASETTIAGLKEEVKQAKQKVVDENTQMTAYRDKVSEEIKAQTEKAEKAEKAVVDERGSKDEQMKKLITDNEAAQKTTQEEFAKAQTAVSELNKKVEALQREIDQLRGRLGLLRANTADSVVRQADGAVVRVPGNGTVYINLGSGDQISPGLTFEVYDRIDGVPPLGDSATDENLPKGKGSIEVVRVGAATSECRIINEQFAKKIREGDLIANLIFDRNTKYQFFVYGDYDLDQNGLSVPGDAEIVKRLITQWGSKVTDKINADTDFVVLGKEPAVLLPTREEANDPIMQARAQASQAAYDEYQDIKKQALDFHIPVLNQNRFLYYVGYFESAKR